MSPEMGWVYQDEETSRWVYRASSLGSCLRSLVAARCGETATGPHATLRAAMDASAGLEDEAIRRFCVEMGDGGVVWQQKEVDLSVPGNGHTAEYIIRGHLDGLHQQSDTVIEVKCLGKDNFAKYNSGGLDALGSLGQKYKMQMAIYGHATQRKVRLVVAEKYKIEDRQTPAWETLVTGWEIGELIIEPPTDPESLVPLVVVYDRVHFIEDHASRDELPECTGGCTEWDDLYSCHLFPSREQGDEELERLLLAYDELKTTLGSKGDEKKEGSGLLGDFEDVKDAIKEKCGPGKFTVGPFNVTISESAGREMVDAKWLKQNHRDIYEQSLRLSKPSVSLLVKKAKGQEESRDERSS